MHIKTVECYIFFGNCIELSQALHAIEEANTGTVAEDVNQPRAQSSRFAQLDHDQKENIVMETESAATKRQTKYGVQICRLFVV
jgi:hypothetical protein